MSINSLYPAILPSLNLSFINAAQLDPRVTFSRSSTATYFDSQGILKTAPQTQPRFDYNPSTGVLRGLLIEQQRTNLALYSNDFTDATWVKTDLTAAANQVGPDNVTNSASSLTATNANATALQTITSASAARFETAYVKRITGSGVIEMTMDNGSTWTAVTVTSSWTRVSIPSQTVTNPVVGFRIVTSGDAIAVYGFQIENGNFATSVIPTTSVSVTRSADSISLNRTNFSNWYTGNFGTFIFDFESGASVSGWNGNPPYDTFTGAVGPGRNDPKFTMQTGSTNFPAVWVNYVSPTAVVQTGPAITNFASGGAWSSGFKAAMAVDITNSIAFAQNGTSASSSVTSSSLTAIPNSFYFNSSFIGARIRKIAFYPARLTDVQLQALTR